MANPKSSFTRSWAQWDGVITKFVLPCCSTLYCSGAVKLHQRCRFVLGSATAPSMRSRLFAFCCVVLCSSFYAKARFVVEKSALKIKFPTSGRQAHPNGFDMSLANFGAPQYGGSLVYDRLSWQPGVYPWSVSYTVKSFTWAIFCRGKLVYVDPDHGLDFSCEPACRFACQNFSVGQVSIAMISCFCAFVLLPVKAALQSSDHEDSPASHTLLLIFTGRNPCFQAFAHTRGCRYQLHHDG